MARGRDSEAKYHTIYQEIRNRICLLQYPPGTILKEETLAGEFGVSRTPIRRALHRLEYDGLININQRAGAIVTTVDIKFLKEVYALRLKLAELVGDLSHTHVSEENITALEQLREETRQMKEQYDPTELARFYNLFHTEMLNVIGNEPLREISDRLFHQTARVWLQILPDLNWTEEVEIMLDEITEVVKALRAGDMGAVAQIRRNHMAMLLRRTNDYLGSADAG